MIEKCSIGNISYNLQNITLILLILILIIVIIYYLKNSSTKHNELIEKYTNTDIKSDESYNTHNAIADSLTNSEFPTTGTEVSLRPCQVQFNDKFDDNANDTVRYIYQDGWQEIATLKEPGLNSTFKDIPIKIISRSNETNKDAITNYSERSKCFRKMSDTDNKYRYQGNDLIQYSTGNNLTKGIHSQLNAGGALEDYMEMKFNLDPSKTSEYYNNLKTSICSLKYSNTLGGTSLGGTVLYRLTLDRQSKITAINQITINSTNNHIFTVNSETDLAALLTSSGRTISYVYNGTNFVYKDKLNNTETQSDEKNNIDVEIYTFDRELLCNEKGKDYQTIKSYKIIKDKKINVNKILEASSGDVDDLIENTSFPGTVTDQSYSSKDSLLTAIETRIKSEKDSANASVYTEITNANKAITTKEGERDVFLASINTKATFFDKIFDATTTESEGNFLVSESGLINGLELNKLGYTAEDVSSSETLITATQEPSFSKIVNNTSVDIYTIETYTDTSIPYTKTFDKATICDILIVGGGGSGDRQIGGGGGGGAVLYASRVEIPPDTYTIKVGKGGENGNGGNSEAFGATCLGGGSTDFKAWSTANNGKAGGSGSGGSPGASTGPAATGGTVGTSTKGSLLNSGTMYNGNPGGNALPQVSSGGYHMGGGGGGGAGTAGFNSTQTLYTTRSSWIATGRPSSGGDGIPINITGTTYYWGAGGGGAGHYGSHPGDGGLGGGGGGGTPSDNGAIAGLAGTGGINSGGDGLNTGTENGGNGGAGTGSGGGGGGYNNQSTTYNGGKGGSGIVIIRYKNVPEQIGNENEKQITLKYDNKMIFTYRTDEPNYSWDEAYNEAITNGRRMPTIKELRDYMDSSPTVFSAFNGMDVWIPVLNSGTVTGRDWVQAGNSPHTRGKSHTQDLGVYPWWGYGTTADYAKVYFEVNDRITNYTTTLPTKTDVTFNGNAKTLDAGTYDIIMNPSGSEIINRATKVLIGTYAHTDGDKLIFKYVMTRTLKQLHELSTTFSGTQYKSSIANQKYSLGTKTINKITKYRIYIYKKHSVNHTIQLYAGDKLLTYGTDYTSGGSNQEAGVPTINLYNFYITINKTISGAIYLTSDKPIFYIDEPSRTTFNNTTDTVFKTKVDKLKESGTPTSDNSTTTLTRLNIMYGVTEATVAKTRAEGKLITYNIGANAKLTIDYKNNLVSNTSLDNLATTYNTISGYSPEESGGIKPILNANFGNILNPETTNIEEYISYEFPSPPTDTQITPANRANRFNIKSQATKYIYFKKRGGANSN